MLEESMRAFQSSTASNFSSKWDIYAESKNFLLKVVLRSSISQAQLKRSILCFLEKLSCLTFLSIQFSLSAMISLVQLWQADNELEAAQKGLLRYIWLRSHVLRWHKKIETPLSSWQNLAWSDGLFPITLPCLPCSNCSFKRLAFYLPVLGGFFYGNFWLITCEDGDGSRLEKLPNYY